MSSSSSSSGDGEEGGVASGTTEEEEIAQTSERGRRRGEPSSSRQRSGDGVWPEPFVEAVAVRVAAEASRDGGRLAAAPAVAALFQVCSTWRAVSHSELLWQILTRRIWSAGTRQLPTWRDDYIRRHLTARNFHNGNAVHIPIVIHDAADPALACRCLALSDHHLAAGYVDGSVRLFELPSTRHLATYGPHPGRDVLGPFSRTISGVLLDDDSSCLVYASQDGDIHVASTRDTERGSRRSRVGNVVEDGTLVDFSGSRRWWVGLFAGVPGRSVQVWDGGTEQRVHFGGSLMDPDSVQGWHMLTELSGPVGRVRVADPDGTTLVGCAATRVQAINLDADVGAVLEEHELARPAILDAVDACEGRVLVVDSRGVATVRQACSLEVVCRFTSAGRGRGARQLSGCLNWGLAVVCFAGRVRVWDARTGEHLYTLRERVGGDGAGVVTASDRHLAVWTGETGLHLWDFGGAL